MAQKLPVRLAPNIVIGQRLASGWPKPSPHEKHCQRQTKMGLGWVGDQNTISNEKSHSGCGKKEAENCTATIRQYSSPTAAVDETAAMSIAT